MDKHNKNSLLIGLPLLFIILSSHFSHAAEFGVNVPHRGEVTGLLPLRDIDLFVDLPASTTGIVGFRVTRGLTGDPDFIDFSVNSEEGFPNSVVGPEEYSDDEITPPERSDEVTISIHHVPDIVGTKRFKIHMLLKTNWTDDSGICANRQSAAETWTIETTSAASITGTCINSYEPILGSASCDDRLLVQATETPATIISTSDIPTITPCEDERPPIDVMLVLDKSGSMLSNNKIGALNDAVNNFVDVWNQSGIAKPGDKLGVVLFNQDALDWEIPPDLSAGLNPFTSTLKTAITTNSISAGGATSIGDGLKLAATHLINTTPNPPRRIILLMSDGRQNSDRMAAVVPDNGVCFSTADVDGDGDCSPTDLVAVTHLRNGTDFTQLPSIKI